MKEKKFSRKALIATVAGLVLATLAGYFLLISPQRSKAKEVQGQIEQTRREIEQLRLASRQVQKVAPIRVADLFRVTKAMPDEIDMPGVLLQLNRIASDSGIRFESITPQGLGQGSGYQTQPISLVFQGNFYELADFLYRVRSLVGVQSGKLSATGRLFVVETLDFAESEKKFPQIRATLTVSAFVYGTGVPAVAPPVTPPTETTTTSDTAQGETTPAPDTAPEAPPVSAVGAH